MCGNIKDHSKYKTASERDFFTKSKKNGGLYARLRAEKEKDDTIYHFKIKNN